LSADSIVKVNLATDHVGPCWGAGI
jgi:hypothetical protein